MPTIAAPQQFHSIDVLSIVPSSATGARPETFARVIDGRAGAHGALVESVPDAPLPEVRTISWTLRTRAQLAVLEDFLSRRRGQLNAFWCPTFRQDAIVLTCAPAFTLYTFQTSAYVTAYPRLAAERNGYDYWWARSRTGAIAIARASAVADNGDGTSNLTLNENLGAVPTPTATGTVFCRLELSRLNADTVPITYVNGALATVEVSVRTIPRESL